MDRGRWGAVIVLLLLVASFPAASLWSGYVDVPPEAPVVVEREEVVPGPAAPARSGPVPLFTENRGQFGDWPARFYARGTALSVALGDGWVAYHLHDAGEGGEGCGRVVRVSFPGARQVAPTGAGDGGHMSHFLLGRDPSGWVTDVPGHGSVVYGDLWDGVDLRFLLEGGMLKYEFTVAPGADPGAVAMRYEGTDSLELCPDSGDLLVRAGGSTLRDQAPLTYQEDEGRRSTVPSSFRIAGDGLVAFELASHNPRLPLVIDPGLFFSTFLGGSGDDAGNGVAVDGDGKAYVVGHTTDSSFPVTPGAYDTSFERNDAFVSKFKADGSDLEYSTFVGGSEDDEATGVAVADDGTVVVAGMTVSTDFPTTSSAFCTTVSSAGNAFVLRLAKSGSALVYSTYLGGSLGEVVTAVDLDSNVSAYIAGYTYSDDFPEVRWSFRRTGYRADAFVVKLEPDGSHLEYSCLLGGNWSDEANDVVVDDAGCAYVTGSTGSPTFPTTPLVFSREIGSSEWVHDVFVSKIAANGRSLVYSTFIGHRSEERGLGIDVDGAGCAYVTGFTYSGHFPMVPKGEDYGLYRTSPDTFVLKLNGSGKRLLYSKVLEIRYEDRAQAVAVDAEGCALVAGYLSGRANLTATENAVQPRSYNDNRDAFVLRLDDHGDKVLYSSFLGGDGHDYGNDLALDEDGLIYVTGTTFSAQGFPATPGAYDNTSNVNTTGEPRGDAFLCKMDISIPYLVANEGNRTATTGDVYTFRLVVADNVGVTGVAVQYWFGENGTHRNLYLVLGGGDARNGTWTGDIFAPLDSLEFLYFKAWALDVVGLNGTLLDYSILVEDNDLPELENLSPASACTGNTVNLSVRVVDNIAVGKVSALYTPGGLIGLGAGSVPLPMAVESQDGDVYNFTITMAWYSVDDLEYRFWANDTSGNAVMSPVYTLEVLDDDRPLLTVGRLPREVTTGQELDLRIHVRDNIGVANVTCTWMLWGGNGTGPVTVPMNGSSVDGTGVGHYTVTLRVPREIDPSVAPRLMLSFTATDVAGNGATSAVFWIDVRDDDPPWLEDLSDGNATTGDPFTISFRVVDNAGLERVWLRYWIGSGGTVETTLVQGPDGLWNLTVDVPHARTALHYVAGATDVNGITNWSAQGDRLVRDNDPPVVVTDTSDREGTTGDPLTFEVEVEDNLFVVQVRVVLWMATGPGSELQLVGRDVTSSRNGTYRATMDAPYNESGPLGYVVEAMDLDGNVGTSEVRYVDVRDDDVPWFGRDLSDEEAWRGEEFGLEVEAWDNVAVEELWCEWWFGEGARSNNSMHLGGAIVIDVPREPGGPLHYSFAARDAGRNWNWTGTYTRSVRNQVPTVVGLDVWNVTEDVWAEVDLLEHIVDRDDTGWQIAVNRTDSQVLLEGYTLRIMHRVWVQDYRLELSLSDGRDVTWHNVTVHVEAVNDAPVLLDVRYNGALVDPVRDVPSFREGRGDALVVVAMDEEGDPLTFVWLKGDEEVHRGEVLRRGDLPLGMYTLTLEVSDGMDTTTYEVTVSVEEAEGITVGTWILVIVVIVIAATVAVLLTRRTNRLD